MKKKMEFASIYNECLAYIHQGLSSTKTRGNITTNMEEMVISIANMYISKHSSTRTASSEWEGLLNKPQTRASFASVAFADAWWGYQGLMCSGLNPWVGGGAAAVGSACAFLH